MTSPFPGPGNRGRPDFFDGSGFQTVFCVISFAFLFHLVYVTYLAERWGYMGFSLSPISAWEIVLTYIIAVLPVTLLPRRSGRRTILVFFVLYYLVYVPSQFCILYSSLELTRALSMQLVFCAGFGLVALSFHLETLSIDVSPMKWRAFVLGIMGLGGLCLALIYRVGVESIDFVSFFEASGLRKERDTASLFLPFGSGYLFSWVTYVVAPISIIIGLMRKNIFLVGFGFLTELAIFAATTNKFALLAAPFAAASWLLCRRDDGRQSVRYVSWGSVILLVLILAVNAALETPNVIEQVLSFFVMRYFGYQGMSSVLYAKFTENNPYTYWSHVSGISAIVDYPFDESIPLALGSFWTNKAGVSAPAHPWAQDGLLAAGLSGVLVISIIIAVVFWVTDSMTARVRGHVLVPLLLIQGIMLSESSIFTQILSNGLALLCLVACVAPRIFRVDDTNTLAC
jgi:hypothetical protein